MTLLLTESTPAIDALAANDCFDIIDHAERRRGLRVRQSRPVRVYEAAGARQFTGTTEDISATGIRIELSAAAALRPGNILSVYIGLNREGWALANRRQILPARVVWVERGNSFGQVVAGVEFIASIAVRLDAA
jgi:c-di-GMP-binding flagellar brake protein YcgR